MNSGDVLRMAREANIKQAIETPHLLMVHELGRFAALVAAAEREACAKVCDAVQKKNEDEGAWMWEARNCAAAIRARGQA